ncbi:MAG: hypothetical protein A2X35_02605 [Elusimicrobia bacterium GWA2_61_42]|nr:MAG: hypothetical protein A2X35_02605 [Elusimicrobia bacterium GWA2_61_42]
MGITKLIKAISKRKIAPNKSGAAPAGGGGRTILDHPQRGEKITSPQYTFRVGATGDIERVEISIDHGAWQPCRYSVGYWWYDWAGYTDGRYQAETRARTKDGRLLTAEPCKFQVAAGLDGKKR